MYLAFYMVHVNKLSSITISALIVVYKCSMVLVFWFAVHSKFLNRQILLAQVLVTSQDLHVAYLLHCAQLHAISTTKLFLLFLSAREFSAGCVPLFLPTKAQRVMFPSKKYRAQVKPSGVLGNNLLFCSVNDGLNLHALNQILGYLGSHRNSFKIR